MMGNKEKEYSTAIQEADFEASGEIMATSSIQHPSEALVFTNKAGLFRQEGKAWGVDEIIIMVNHFVDGEILYTAERVHSAHKRHSIIHGHCLTD